jgi:hypothetical protein
MTEWARKAQESDSAILVCIRSIACHHCGEDKVSYKGKTLLGLDLLSLDSILRSISIHFVAIGLTGDPYFGREGKEEVYYSTHPPLSYPCQRSAATTSDFCTYYYYIVSDPDPELDPYLYPIDSTGRVRRRMRIYSSSLGVLTGHVMLGTFRPKTLIIH